MSKTDNNEPKHKSRINTSSESREKELINLAMDAVEERIKSGKASASEYVHFLKLGTEQAKLEREKLKSENKLLEAKTQSIEQSDEVRKIVEEAMAKLSSYRGEIDYYDEEDEEEYEHTRSRRSRRRR